MHMLSRIIETYAILALIGIFLDTFVYCPLIIYWSLHIWKQRHSLVIRKRHSRIIITIGIVSCLYYLVQRNVGFLIYSDILSHNATLTLTYLNCYLWPIFNYGLFYIMVYRYWLLFFKTKFAAAQSNGEWQMIINPSQYDTNWWITNKKRFGSGHVLRKYIILLWILIVCIEGTLWLLSYALNSNSLSYIGVSIDFLIILIPFILTIYIRQHLPLFIDKLLIKQELKYIFLIIFLSFIVIALLSSIIGVLSYFVHVLSTKDVLLSLYNTVSNISTFGTFLCVYIQTEWVLYKFNSDASQQRLNTDKISISDVLTHDDAFYVFMNHLIGEHSSECLLSLVEMVQYKESILNDMKYVDNEKETKEEQEEEEEAKEKEEEQQLSKRSSEVQRNINALQLALSAPATKTIRDDNSMLFGAYATPTATNRKRRISTAAAALTEHGLIALPSNVPKSAIVYKERLDILMDIPGVEISPKRRRGTTIDDDVINNSKLMTQTKHNESVQFNTMKNTENANAAFIEEYKIRGFMLYYKYIAPDSEYEINIDYGTRNTLMYNMNDINVWLKNENITINELSVLFDPCIHQMYQFCKFSMGRFKLSDDFKRLSVCFDQKTP